MVSLPEKAIFQVTYIHVCMWKTSKTKLEFSSLFFFFCLKKYKRMSLYYLTSDPYLLWCWQQIHKTEPPYFFSLYHFLSEDKSKVPNISGFHFPAWAIACLRHWSVLKRCTVLHPEEDWCRLVKTLWTLINPVLPIDQVFQKKKKKPLPLHLFGLIIRQRCSQNILV